MNAPYPAQPTRWIKPLLLLGACTALLLLAMFVMVQFQLFRPADATATWVPIATDTQVNFVPGDSQRLYRFDAHPLETTRLKLDSQTPGFAFVAEVRNSTGDTIAAFNGALENIDIELVPGSGLYQLAVASADATRSGTVLLSVADTTVTPVRTTVSYMPMSAPACSVINSSDADVLVRSAPGDSFTILGTLARSTTLPALGSTDDGWIAVNTAERQGWLRSEVASLNGDCASLPRLLNPTIPNAPADTEVYAMEIDRDGEGSFREVISAPQGDTTDLIWVNIVNLYTTPPSNYREFTLTLNCTGTALDSVRWGSAYSPTLGCGQSLTVPFMIGSSQQPFLVRLPEGSRQSYAAYTLTVTQGGSVG